MALPTEPPPAKPARQPLYESSTQYKNWRFSPDELVRTRDGLNRAAVDSIRMTFETGESGSSEGVSFLSWPEEILLVKLYISKIPQLCSHFRFPEEVEATAISYLKRFYLKNTVMDWHPKNVMLTALFLATKTTNNPISLEAYTANIPKTAPSDVLDLEFLVSQSLNFEFTVWHAHRALWGIVLDVQSLPPPPDFATPSNPNLYEEAISHIRASRLTDAELLYTPSQIALAAVAMVEPDLASRWMEEKHVALSSKTALTTLQSTVEAVKLLIVSSGAPPQVEDVREVDRRLRTCKNPEKVVGSKAYLLKQAEEEKRAEEKRNKKAIDIQKAIADGDPFGDSLKTGGGLVDYDDDDD